MARMPLFSVVDSLEMGGHAWRIFDNLLKGKLGGTGETSHRTTNLSDEALILQLDSAILQLYPQEGPQYIYALRLIRQNLKPHELVRWRKVLLSMEIPDLTDAPIASHTTKRDRHSDQTVAQSLRRRGGKPLPQESVTEEWKYGDPVRKSTAFTVDDPRIRHLVQVAKLVLNEADTAEGIVVALNYLDYSIFVEEKVLEELGHKALAGGKVILSAAQRAWFRSALGEEAWEVICAHYPDPDERDRVLTQSLRHKLRVRQDQLQARKRFWSEEDPGPRQLDPRKPGFRLGLRKFNLGALTENPTAAAAALVLAIVAMGGIALFLA